MSYPKSYSEVKTISVFDIYGTDTPKKFNDYDYIDFRPPRIGEIFLADLQFISCYENNDKPYGPRIILKKIEPPKPRRWVVEEGKEPHAPWHVSKIWVGDDLVEVRTLNATEPK